jgi:hypothetical protein
MIARRALATGATATRVAGPVVATAIRFTPLTSQPVL